MRGLWTVTKRSVVGFYDDQGTHHAAALTYYALMSLFPVALLAVSLLGLIGEYPATYNSIIRYLSEVVPSTTLAPLDDAVRAAFRSSGTATAALLVGTAAALYGGTGYLEAMRRALNVVFEVGAGRSFLRRKLTDSLSLIVLMMLVLATLVLMFAGTGMARDILGPGFADVWGLARWPAAVAVALLVFSFVYYVTPDVSPRSFRWITPGAVVGVALWVLASLGFSFYLRNFTGVNVTYGSFAAAIILLVWLWLTNVAVLFGSEVNAEIEREKQLREGVPEEETLDLRERG